jgi:DNA-binding protein H-NS
MILGFTMNGPDPDKSRANAELLQEARELLERIEVAKAERAETRERQVREFNDAMGRGRRQ